VWQTSNILKQNLFSSSLLSKNMIKVYRTIILPFVMYGFGTWSVTLRQGHRLKMFEDRILWKLMGPKGDDTIRDWRLLHNEELRDLYSSPNNIWVIKSRRLRCTGHVTCMGERGKLHRVLLGKCGKGTAWKN
jgi:hypothetical protein